MPGSSCKGCDVSLCHVGQEAEGQPSREQRVDSRQDDQAVNKDTQDNCSEVETKLTKHDTEVFHLNHHGSHEEEDTDR